MEKFLTYPSFLLKLKKDWEIGQHLAIVAPTGGGKTYLAADVITLREYILAFVSKRKDKTIDNKFKSFVKIDKFQPLYGEKRIMLWKKPTILGDFTSQRIVFYDALSRVWQKGGWNIYFDDIFYLSQTLRLKQQLQMLYTNLRSEDISLIASVQRPSWLPLEVLSQSSHLLLLKTRSIMDIGKAAEMAGYDRRYIVALNQQLTNHDFLWLSPSGVTIVRRD